MKPARGLLALGLAAAAAPAWAGPPFLTDDPAPTDLMHWEIYAFSAATGRGSSVDDDSGFDLNYGAAGNLQLTATLPLSFTHDAQHGWSSGTGDVELAAKYRFIDDERSGFSAAVFPRAILPTSSIEKGERTRILLPLWLQQDLPGDTSLFGGGGYELNPGPGNRNFWQAGMAVTHDVTKHVTVGGEIYRQGPDSVGGSPETSAGVGAIIDLGAPFSLLFSGGPTWSGDRTSYHLYGALGLNF